MTRTEYQIIAYPNGARRVVGTFYGHTDHNDLQLRVAAMTVGVATGSEGDAIIKMAQVQAQVRGEFVDVERNGSLIATVDAHGPIDALPNS